MTQRRIDSMFLVTLRWLLIIVGLMIGAFAQGRAYQYHNLLWFLWVDGATCVALGITGWYFKRRKKVVDAGELERERKEIMSQEFEEWAKEVDTALTDMIAEKRTYDEVAKELKDAEIPFRVRSRDGQAMIGTRDYKPERVNLSVVDGIVTAAHRG